MAAGGSLEAVRQEVVRRFNGTNLSDWRNTRPALTAKPVLDWNNTDIGDALRLFEAKFAKLDPAAWLRVRDYVLEQSGRAK